MTNNDFNISVDELKEFSELHGEEVGKALEKHGGIEGLASKLHTSITSGLSGDETDLAKRKELFGENWIAPKDAKTFL